MTKKEAIDAMQEGKKVRHHYFTHEEFITMKYGRIYDENGINFSPGEFWSFRNGKEYEDEWYLFMDSEVISLFLQRKIATTSDAQKKEAYQEVLTFINKTR